MSPVNPAEGRAFRPGEPIMSLKAYRAKRDFSRTPEPKTAPAPKKKASAARKGLIYAIQEHHASRLHYDLRLEDGGVLKSWAIPKTPPRKAGEKRLAVETEDHPLEYAGFEGVIPEGEYGGGTVRIWDAGDYRPVESAGDKRIVDIRGRKLKGLFALIRLKPRPGEKPGRVSWLFFKTGSRS